MSGRSLNKLNFNELNTVAERVPELKAGEARERNAFQDLDAMRFQRLPPLI